MVDFKTVQIMYRVKHQLLPNNIQKLFQMRESQHDLKVICMFKHPVRTNAKHYITVKRVNLWNNVGEEMKTCRTLSKFKQIFKNNILNGYGMNDQREVLE